MATLEELASNELIQKEYKKTLLLNMFKKVVVGMYKNPAYRDKIWKLFMQSTNVIDTTTAIIKKAFNVDLALDDARLMSVWFKANLKKKATRRNLPLELKKKLYVLQNGKCLVCGEDLGNDYSKIHVDHIIPWLLVGDELDNNYQDLCETCNECKSASTDYIFRSMINLI